MKWFTLSIIVILTALVIISCSKDAIQEEMFGIIEGSVIDSKTEEPVRNVNITTTPPTNSILTDDNGVFELYDIPTGNYTVKASRPGYRDKSVSVSVRDKAITTAKIYFEQYPDESVESDEMMEVVVTSWHNYSNNDSSFVDVAFKVLNISERTDIQEYEVYFEINSHETSYYFEAEGSDLKVGQYSFGEFNKYIRQDVANNVNIIGVWYQ
jgi:hypothetical protein